jgi:putative ABC transport system permease protein
MTFLNYIHQSFLYFITAKLRAFLAMLGILVGTAAIVALISSGKLATESALAQFKAMGTDLLAINLYQQGTRHSLSSSRKTDISLETWRQFPALIPSVLDVAPYTTLYQQISYEGHPITSPIIGADQSLARIMHIDIEQGHFVSSFESYEHHCVIGHRLAEQLKHVTYKNPIGQQIQIGQTLYTIIGITKPWKENAFFNEDINQAIIVPITGMQLINSSSKVTNAILLLNPSASIDAVILSIKHTIKKQAPKLSVFIRSPKQIIHGMENQGRIFTLLLATIGSISLLVGGIGIMNVMLVSVGERKQEIGIRKALGATKRHIQFLFLTEALFLSITGGVLGILIGLAATWIIAHLNHWPFTLYVLPLTIGFFVSVSTGMFFGFYPAYRAAKLDPVVSLRM